MCGLAHDAAQIVLAEDGLPPSSIQTTDWSVFPGIEDPQLVIDGTCFMLRIPGDAKGLYRSLEEVMDVAGIYSEGYVGLKNHRSLLTAVTKICCGATDRVLVDFSLSPERIRLQEMSRFQEEHAEWWSAHLRCLEDPGCAEIFRRGI